MDKLLISLVVIAILCVLPAIVIWSLNTLFPVADIPHAWNTYLATYGLALLFGSSSAASK